MKTLHTIYTNFAKRFAVVLALLLALGVTSVWGETVTFVPSDFSGQGTTNTGSEMSSTKNGVTFSCDKGFGTTQIRCYKGSTITINSSNIITDISFTFSGNDYNGDLSTTTTALYSGLNTNNWTQKLSAEQARITQCVITYTIPGASTPDPEPDPTTTYSINWHTSTSTCISNTVTANSTIQKPETDPTMDGYTFRGWTDQCEIASNGSNFSPITNFGVAQADKDYYAVFAIKTEGGSDVIDIIDNNVTKNKLGSTGTSSWVGIWETETLASGAKYSIRSMGINNATDYALQWNANAYLYTSSKPQEGLKLKSLTVKTQDSESIKLFGSTSIYTGLASTTALATLSTNSDGATYSLTPEQLANNYTCIGINGNSSSTKVISISITYSAAASYDEYITTCTNEVIVTLDPNGGTGNFTGWDEDDDNYTKTVEKENSVTLPNILEKTGYTFQGWSDGENTYTGQYTPTANVTLTASWKAIDYDITYNLYGGTNHASNPAKYTIETSIITLQAPTKTGYTFGGWYKENTFKTKVTEITKGSTGDISLYAKWTPTSYTITYTGLEGATHSNPTTYTIESETITFTAPSERVGYNFICWTPASIEKGSTGNQTVTAFWNAKKLTNFRTLCTYDIVLKNNYVDDDSKDGHTTITATHTSFSTANNPATREGYEIEGYYAEPECTNKVADDKGNLVANVTNYTDADGKWIGGETTLYTKWTGRTYTVTLDDNGGSGGSGTITATYGSPMPVITLPTRTGYTFNGYWTGKTTQSTQYYDATGGSLKNWDKASNTTTLYALWTANANTPYVVKHYKEQLGGTYQAEADDTDNLTGTTASSVTPAVKSYEGFTAPSTQTVSIAADGSTVVTYLYTRNSYNLSWNLAGGIITTEGTAQGSVKYEAPITAPIVAKSGYNFISWSPEVPATMPAANVTCTAQWQLIQHTITWLKGENTHATTTVSVEQPLSLPTAPEDDALGCCADAFIGWSIYAQPTKEQVFNDVANAPAIDGNKTFHAVFATKTLTEGSATATFNEMGYANAEKVSEIALGDGEGHGNATIVFAKDQSASNYPAYYNTSASLHAYAKNTITINSTSATSTITNVQFTFAAKEDGSNTISASVGNYADGIWTGSAESVVFTIGGETGHRKITSITVTTQAVEQYTNYVTKCTYGNSPTLGTGTITYNSGDGIDVRCENTSAMNTAATLTFPDAADLTCPVTLTASEGFLISTSKSNDAGYQTSLTVSPYKSGSAQAGKLRTIYVRANATGKTENYSGTITISGGEVTEQTISVTANVNCQGYTLTLKDHLGNTIGTPTSHYAGDVIETEPTPSFDACTIGYTFDGWSTAEVEYGSLIYNKVSFPYTMPAEDVTLYPVYQVNTTADYHRVTSDLGLGDVDGNNWAGDYLIAASYQIVADGSTSNLGTINGASIDENIVPASFGDRYYVSLIAVKGGYVLKTQENKNNEKPYVYITPAGTSTATNANLTTADNNPLSVTYNSESDILITNPQNTLGYALKFYSTKFGFYKAGSKIYLYRKSPLYTSSLICEEITVENAMVTSTAGQTVKVNVTATMSNTTVNRTRNLTVESDNADFTATINPTATENEYNVAVSYTPSVEDITDGTETANITIKVNNIPVTSFQVTGRSLPEIFAIVAKVGNVWYALPSQGLNSETTPVGFPVEVDNNDNPTTVTAVPANADWSLRQVYASSGSNDRFAANGENLVFVNAENKTLYANSGNANIQTYAEYTNYAENNPERYEWVPTTTDLTNYTLKNVGRDKDLSINVNATFGTHASNIASNNLRFLPINATYTPFDMQVVEWYPTKVLVQTETALTSVSATVGGVAVASPVVTKKGGKLYEISGLPLENNPTKVLTISYDSYSCSKVIPIIISRATKSVTDAPFSTLTTSAYNYSDLVVRDGATLTINGTKQAPDKFVNVAIYPTAKIVVPENKQLSVYSLTFFGGIDDIYDGEKYTTNKYGVPQLSLKGTLGKTVTTMDYIMRVNLDQMYQVGVPYDVSLNEITYWDGSAIKLGDELYVSAYDGQARANLDLNNTWIWEVDFAEKVLKAGVGYTISAEPQLTGDEFSILRMPMKSNISSGSTEGAKTINVVAYDNQKSVAITDNHKGWNYLSNPYMTAISGGEADSELVLGYLKETGTGPWEWVNDEIRYVTIPQDDGEDYKQKKFSEATLLPFKSFFVQIAEAGELSFALASRQNAPARYMEVQTEQEVEFEILLSNDKQSDNTGLLIAEQYSPAYEINADLEKMIGSMSVYTIYGGYNLAYNAISPINASEWIPMGYIAPAAGEYTFRLDDIDKIVEQVEHVYLIDYEANNIVDLMDDEYEFTTDKEQNNNRFAINIVLIQDKDNTTTGMDIINGNVAAPIKFIYHDKMYIQSGGVIYDGTGKQVTNINK